MFEIQELIRTILNHKTNKRSDLYALYWNDMASAI